MLKQLGGGAFHGVLMFAWPLVILFFVAALGGFGYALWHTFTAIPWTPTDLLGSTGLAVLLSALAWKTERDLRSDSDRK